MNQAQRNFLIKKIQDVSAQKIDNLKNQMPEYPSLSNYLFHAVMKDEFELQPIDNLKDKIRQKALKAKEGQNWLSEDRMGWDKENTIKLLISDLFVLPENYKKELSDFKEKMAEINEQIREVKVQSDTLVTRIQLASDKTLQTMINEVDDMGNISLIDTKLKLALLTN